MSTKDKNKYGIHPYDVGIKKNMDGSSTKKDKSYLAGPCVFPYKLLSDEEHYKCFHDVKINADVCPTSLHKKTKKIKTVGVCYDLKKLNCVIPEEEKQKAKKKSNKGKKGKKKANNEGADGAKKPDEVDKKFCSGIHSWCTGGFPTMNSPPKDPLDMKDKYEVLRQQSGYGAFFTNPDGTCLFHSIAGSIICDPELALEFLKGKIKFMEQNYLSAGEKISGSNYGEILRNGYIALVKSKNIIEIALHISNVIRVGDIKEYKKVLKKVLKKITDDHIENLRNRQIASGFFTEEELISADDKDNYLGIISKHFSDDEKRFELVPEDIKILNYMRDKFLEKVKDKSVYTEEPMGRELCKALNINLKRHTVYINQNADLVYHMEEEENKPPDCANVNIYYNGENHFEFVVKLDYLDILPDILSPIVDSESVSSSSASGSDSNEVKKTKKAKKSKKSKKSKKREKAEKAKKSKKKGKKARRGSMSD